MVTKGQTSYKAGQQIFTSYGRRSNKFLLVFYGFCIKDNKHDSVTLRIHRKLPVDAKSSVEGVASAILLTPDQVSEEFAQLND